MEPQYATKEDVTAAKDELRTEMTAMEDRLTEHMRAIETNLLNAFYGFAESVQQRPTQHDHYNDRLAVIERRLTDLEKRVHFPNAQ